MEQFFWIFPYVVVALVSFFAGGILGAFGAYPAGREDALREIVERDRQAKAEVMWSNLMKMGGLKNE